MYCFKCQIFIAIPASRESSHIGLDPDARRFGFCDLLLLLLQLDQEQAKASLQGDSLSGPLVIGREARWVRRLGDLAVSDLFEGIQAVAIVVESVHEMHDVRAREGQSWLFSCFVCPTCRIRRRG